MTGKQARSCTCFLEASQANKKALHAMCYMCTMFLSTQYLYYSMRTINILSIDGAAIAIIWQQL
jgi:hypothetical protein